MDANDRVTGNPTTSRLLTREGEGRKDGVRAKMATSKVTVIAAI
jgi:hypothetical protein